MSSTKNSSLVFWTVPLAMVLVMSTTAAGAEMMFKYKSPSVVKINTASQQETAPEPVEVDPACDDPANVDSVGNAPGCQGMLIVGDEALRSAASKRANPDGGYQNDETAHGNFEIAHTSGTYTFADSDKNIFTGQVVDMSYLFRETNFNGDIGYWDVSSVTDMASMFYRNSSFNQDIGSWDVSNVTQMNHMFRSTPFDRDIGGWDISNVNNTRFMFYETPFNQDIGAWDVSSVTRMDYMFYKTPFDRDIGAWDTSSVKYMYDMFKDASHFNQDIGTWDTSNVRSMNRMFKNASLFNQDISGWNVSNVDYYYMFSYGSSLKNSNMPNF
mgnify:CR=1 FL=1